jgi:fumarylacetoacetase
MPSTAITFGLNHLPYGVFSIDEDSRDRRLGVAIGDQIADLRSLTAAGLLSDPSGALSASTLNPLMTEGSQRWAQLRAALAALLADTSKLSAHLVSQSSARMHLAWDVADYVDFYSSLDHATNVGKMFRPDADALLPNWKHLPVGYHGRAGTVVVSGTDIVRPSGQRKGPNDAAPVFGASTRLDIEAEVGFVVGVPSMHGSPVPTTAFADHVFGVVLVNDWSARDIQAWEYQPLGPFLGKSFATSVSAWVTPLAALANARCAPPTQDPTVLNYLVDHDPWALDLQLSVRWNDEEVSTPPFSTMYWTPGQQLAHMTVNGASLRTGDLFASGTISGPTKRQRGSFLELSWGGAEPLTFANGSTRTFLLDGDSVTISATATGVDGETINLGPVTGVVHSS